LQPGQNKRSIAEFFHVLPGIYSYGFEKPSAIQQRGIKPILDGRDTIGQAQSGRARVSSKGSTMMKAKSV